ncbi:MAG: hypothetical protein IPJ49_14625 [Candidatus Obscuribacter sp.]|nr:hypothetical protein [Candidatus Obscuribacter sp.]
MDLVDLSHVRHLWRRNATVAALVWVGILPMTSALGQVNIETTATQKEITQDEIIGPDFKSVDLFQKAMQEQNEHPEVAETLFEASIEALKTRRNDKHFELKLYQAYATLLIDQKLYNEARALMWELQKIQSQPTAQAGSKQDKSSRVTLDTHQISPEEKAKTPSERRKATKLKVMPFLPEGTPVPDDE